MTYLILAKSGTVLARSTIQHITTTDLNKETMKESLRAFDGLIRR
jgi:hypothetical protein